MCTHEKSGTHRGCDLSYSHHHRQTRQNPQVDKARATDMGVNETHLCCHSPELRPLPITAHSSLDQGYIDPEFKLKQERPEMLPCCWWDHRSGEGKAGHIEPHSTEARASRCSLGAASLFLWLSLKATASSFCPSVCSHEGPFFPR